MARLARSLVPFALLGLLLAACTEASGPSPETSTVGTAVGSSTSVPSPTPRNSATTDPSPVPLLPIGLPPSYPDDVPAADVPAAALIPLQTEVTGTWRALTEEGEAIVVAWQVPGPDPFRLARGVAAWRRFDDGGLPWRPVWGVAFGKRSGVLSIDATAADVTGDGSDDFLVFRSTGGSGGCGTAEVVDLAAGSSVFTRDLCDARLEPSVDPVGLALTEAVYAAGDPHCCPSATRTTVLVWDGEAWATDSVSETPV